MLIFDNFQNTHEKILQNPLKTTQQFLAIFIVYEIQFLQQNFIKSSKMKNMMFSLIIFTVFLSLSFSRHIVDLVGPFSHTAFKCLYNDRNVTWISVRVYSLDNGGSIDPNGLQTMRNVANTGIPYQDGYMVICRNNDPVGQVQKVMNHINFTDFPNVATFWIRVIPNIVPGCEWEGHTHEDNCAFLTAALTHFSDVYQPPTYTGVFTTRNIWNRYFGTTCDSLGWTWLWYADYDNTGHLNTSQDVNDFVPFGGWYYPTVKQYGGNLTVSLCGNPKWHGFIDLAVYPWWP